MSVCICLAAFPPYPLVRLTRKQIDNEDNLPAHFHTLATTLRSHFASAEKTYYLSSAPQCPFPDASDPLPLLLLCDFVCTSTPLPSPPLSSLSPPTNIPQGYNSTTTHHANSAPRASPPRSNNGLQPCPPVPFRRNQGCILGHRASARRARVRLRVWGVWRGLRGWWRVLGGWGWGI